VHQNHLKECGEQALRRDMSLSSQITPHLPYLRRFARALSGSQESGDAYVAAVLQAAIADPASLEGVEDMRVALYRMLGKVWSSVSWNSKADGSKPRWEATVQDRLSNMSGREREVFLLKSVEGFDMSDIAKILEVTPEEAMQLYDSANAQIAEMMSSDVLIIEDEPLIALDLEEIITSLGHRAIGVARTRREASEIAAQKRPQLVLSDIQLADNSSGVDAVNDLLNSFDVPVIFVTAYPERLLTGEKPEPAFLISKPYSAHMIKAVIAQALFFDVKSSKGERLAS
jgi:DNA-directed RNA polymerase specialized sigma24 family protein/CheY-like chemotaxis protein